MNLKVSSLNKVKAKYLKLKKNPKLFVHDWLVKNIQIDPMASNTKTITKEIRFEDIYVGFNYSTYLEKGIVPFIKEIVADPIKDVENDLDVLYLWKGRVELFVSLLEWIKFNDNFNIKVYTPTGGINFSSNQGEKFDKDYLIRMIKKPSNIAEFYVELENAVHCKNFKVFGYNIDVDNNIVFQSNNSLLKKININKFEESFNKIIDNNPVFKENIDVVYTWVNKDDNDWKQLWLECYPESIIDSDRFTSNDELKYSLRSIDKYAPWVRNIYILSNCNPPDWLKLNDKIKWIDHKEIIDPVFLPTFNSHAIETNLHKIKGLSKFFIYFNDDVFLSQPASKEDFINIFGQTASFFEDYSMVDPLNKQETDYDYIKASKNSQNLLNSVYPNYFASRLHKHVPTVLNKEILFEIENKFHKNLINTRSAKLRSDDDINLTSFFYHHYAMCNNLNYQSACNSLLVRPTNIKNLNELKVIPYQFLCFNDGGGSSVNSKYKDQVRDIFNFYYQFKSKWEK